MSEKNVAWMGLGLIGLPMAARLAAAGWTVRGFDVNPARAELARARGIAPAADAAEALAGAGLVFSSLPSEAALLGLAAPLARLRAGTVLVETSTVGPRASAQLAAALRPGGVEYLRAPVSGSTALAEAGTLTTFVSGPRGAFERAQAAMRAYSRAQLWLGEGEEARYAKLAVNLMVAVSAGMVAEGLALGRKGGLDWNALLDLVAESAVASPLLKYKLEPLRRRDFTPAFTSAMMVKDMELVVGAAEEAGVPAPLARHLLETYRAMAREPYAGEDFFSIVKRVERAAGLDQPR